jgi:hypothetical protein
MTTAPAGTCARLPWSWWWRGHRAQDAPDHSSCKPSAMVPHGARIFLDRGTDLPLGSTKSSIDPVCFRWHGCYVKICPKPHLRGRPRFVLVVQCTLVGLLVKRRLHRFRCGLFLRICYQFSGGSLTTGATSNPAVCGIHNRRSFTILFWCLDEMFDVLLRSSRDSYWIIFVHQDCTATYPCWLLCILMPWLVLEHGSLKENIVHLLGPCLVLPASINSWLLDSYSTVSHPSHQITQGLLHFQPFHYCPMQAWCSIPRSAAVRYLGECFWW